MLNCIVCLGNLVKNLLLTHVLKKCKVLRVVCLDGNPDFVNASPKFILHSLSCQKAV